MRTTILLIAGMLFSAKLLAGVVVQNAACLPLNPTTNDSVFITYTIYHPAYPRWRFAYDLVKTGNNYLLKICERLGHFDGADYQHDTLNLGILSSGSYNFKIEYFLTNNFATNDSTCNMFQSPVDSGFVSFTVSSLNNINSVSESSSYLLQCDKLYLNAAGSTNMQLQVVDLTGRIFYTIGTKIATGPNVVKLDIPTLPAGLYFYQLQVGDRVKVLKWVQP